MRHYFYTCLLATSVLAAPAFAAPIDFTPDGTRYLDDIAFVPMEGQILGTTRYAYNYNRSVNINAQSGRQTAKSVSNLQSYNQTLAYGVTDNFAVRASQSYVPQQKFESANTNGTTTIRHADGFNNTVFGLTYRVIDQGKSQPLSFDLLADYAPDIFKSTRTNNATSNGSVALGGDYATGGFRVSQVTRFLTLSGVGGVNYTGDRKSTTDGTPTVVKLDNFWGFYVGGYAQIRPLDRLSLDAGVRYTYNTRFDGVTLPAGTTFSRDPGDSTALNVGVNYAVTPRLIAGVGYELYLLGDTNTDYINPASDTRQEVDMSQVYSARLRYLFN